MTRTATEKSIDGPIVRSGSYQRVFAKKVKVAFVGIRFGRLILIDWSDQGKLLRSRWADFALAVWIVPRLLYYDYASY